MRLQICIRFSKTDVVGQKPCKRQWKDFQCVAGGFSDGTAQKRPRKIHLSEEKDSTWRAKLSLVLTMDIEKRAKEACARSILSLVGMECQRKPQPQEAACLWGITEGKMLGLWNLGSYLPRPALVICPRNLRYYLIKENRTCPVMSNNKGKPWLLYKTTRRKNWKRESECNKMKNIHEQSCFHRAGKNCDQTFYGHFFKKWETILSLGKNHKEETLVSHVLGRG